LRPALDTGAFGVAQSTQDGAGAPSDLDEREVITYRYNPGPGGELLDRPPGELRDRRHALLALMLVTSILREEQEWCVELRMDNALYEES
jgi:hypothetical protein